MPQNRQTVRRQRPSGRTYNMGYVDGNTVRKLEPAPYEDQRRKRERARREQAERRRRAQQDHNRQIAVRNQARVIKIDLKYTLFLGVAVVVTLLMCVYYLNLQSRLTSLNSNISGLKSELTTLTDANQATRERIDIRIDLEKVYELATEELGMHYPTKDQIIYYSGTSDDYVKQYKEIPQSGN